MAAEKCGSVKPAGRARGKSGTCQASGPPRGGRGAAPGTLRYAARARFASSERVTAENTIIATSDTTPTPANAYHR